MSPHSVQRQVWATLGGWRWLLVWATWLGLGCRPEPSATLRVGINCWPTYEFFYLAQEKGWFREQGLDVRIVEFGSLSDARRAYERGQINVMGCTPIEVLQVRDRSARSPQVVQVLNYSAGADVILAQPGLTNVAGLRGAKVGVESTSLGAYVLAQALERNGLRLSDVVTVATDQTSLAEAFRRGELTALVTYPPTSLQLLRETRATRLFSTEEMPGEVLDVVAVEADLAARHPTAVAKLLAAFQRAVRHAAEHPAEAHALMARREGLTPEEFRRALTEGIVLVPAVEQWAFLGPGGRLEPLLEATDRVLRGTGQLRGPDRRAGCVNPTFFPPPTP